MPKTYCPDCDAVIIMDKPELDVQFRCPECAVPLEVISIDPFDVDYSSDDDDWSERASEDWDMDWDDDDYT